jgi:hypothetical protein
VLNMGWDLLIAHPPCTYLSRAGAHLWNRPDRMAAARKAMAFFMRLWEAPVPMVCIENPVGLPWKWFRPPDQTIDPWMFGDAARKRTCLWLRGLPLLLTTPGLFSPCETRPVPRPPPLSVDGNGKARHFTDALGCTRDRRDIRSRTFPGIASAMASQWGTLVSTALYRTGTAEKRGCAVPGE